MIAPVVLADGCTWQPSYDGLDGAGQAIFHYVRLTNASTRFCAPPTIAGVSADAPDGTGTITATRGRSVQPDQLPATLAGGSSVRLQITTISALDSCNDATSRPVTSFVMHFDGGAASAVTLDHAIETACEFVYDAAFTD